MPNIDTIRGVSKRNKIICIGDTHFPFHSEAVAKWIIQYIKKNKNSIYAVVQMGDLYDMYSFSKFAKRHIDANEEIRQGRYYAQEFWHAIKKSAPYALLYQIKGNHDDRVAKRVLEKFPEITMFLNYEKLWEFDGVNTLHDSSQALEIWDWKFIHGHRKNGDHCKAVGFSNVVCGHTHRGGTWSMRVSDASPRLITELNCGYVGDPFHPSLIYRPMQKYFTWTHGLGEIEKGVGARFIPYTGEIV